MFKKRNISLSILIFKQTESIKYLLKFYLEPLYLGTLLTISLIGTFLLCVIYSSRENEEQNDLCNPSDLSDLNNQFNVSVINLNNNSYNTVYYDNNAYYNDLLNSKPIDNDALPTYEDVKNVKHWFKNQKNIHVLFIFKI